MKSFTKFVFIMLVNTVLFTEHISCSILDNFSLVVHETRPAQINGKNHVFTQQASKLLSKELKV